MPVSARALAKIRIEFDDRFTRESQKALENFRKNYQQMFKEFQMNAPKESGFDRFSKRLGDVASVTGISSFIGYDFSKLKESWSNLWKNFKMPSLPSAANVVSKLGGVAMKAGSALVLMGSSLVALPAGAITAGLAAGVAAVGAGLSLTSVLADKGIGQLFEEAFQFDAEKIKERDRLNLESYEKEQGRTAQRIADIEEISNKKKDELQVQSNITAEMDRAVTKTKEISDIQLSIQPIAISVLLENGERVKEQALQLYSSLRAIFSTPLYQEVRIRPVLDGSGSSSTGDFGQNPGGFYTPVSSRIGATRLARGADYIPYDDFPASLHRGEAVLPADVADRYRKGAVAGSVTIENFSVNISGDNKRPQDLARELYFHLKRIGQHIEESAF